MHGFLEMGLIGRVKK